MELTVVTQNLKLGALRSADGDPQGRWPLLVERILAAAERVDVVMLCEVVDWHRYGHKQLVRALCDLGLDAAPLAPSRSGIGTALLFRRETMGHWVRHNPDFASETLHGFAVTSFDVGLPAPLSFVPVHLTPFDADAALSEANLVASRAHKYGPFAVVSGDCNYPPASARNPLPDHAAMRAYNAGSRTLLPAGDVTPGTAPEPDRRVARKLAQNGLVDVAWHLFEQTGDHRLLARTGTDDRIDQAWVSSPLAGAVSNYRLLDRPEGASDHHGLVFRIDTDNVDTTDPWARR
ncbi:hypothetical protein ACIRL2_45250 [Embleya sp. NPDC127516]|uniref:hypothetical protein n=1 Tax=Embleya sp. NPDC127516 TaxID=3363990 RepID=UPI00380D26F1